MMFLLPSSAIHFKSFFSSTPEDIQTTSFYPSAENAHHKCNYECSSFVSSRTQSFPHTRWHDFHLQFPNLHHHAWERERERESSLHHQSFWLLGLNHKKKTNETKLLPRIRELTYLLWSLIDKKYFFSKIFQLIIPLAFLNFSFETLQKDEKRAFSKAATRPKHCWMERTFKAAQWKPMNKQRMEQA